MDSLVVKKSTALGGRTWLNILVFGFMGQLAWAMENMYYSTYIQKNITADSWATSLTVAFSAVAAALSTILTASTILALIIFNKISGGKNVI